MHECFNDDLWGWARLGPAAAACARATFCTHAASGRRSRPSCVCVGTVVRPPPRPLLQSKRPSMAQICVGTGQATTRSRRTRSKGRVGRGIDHIRRRRPRAQTTSRGSRRDGRAARDVERRTRRAREAPFFLLGQHFPTRCTDDGPGPPWDELLDVIMRRCSRIGPNGSLRAVPADARSLCPAVAEISGMRSTALGLPPP